MILDIGGRENSFEIFRNVFSKPGEAYSIRIMVEGIKSFVIDTTVLPMDIP
jgi:hypothetical protein